MTPTDLPGHHGYLFAGSPEKARYYHSCFRSGQWTKCGDSTDIFTGGQLPSSYRLGELIRSAPIDCCRPAYTDLRRYHADYDAAVEHALSARFDKRGATA